MPSPVIRNLFLAGPTPCLEAKAFLERAGVMPSANRKAYIKLINGLVLTGVWPKLDVLQTYVAPTQAIALLNLVSSSNSATINGSPSWAANVGFTNGANGNNIDTGFVLNTGTKHLQNSAHIACWSGTQITAQAARIIAGNTAIPSVPYIIPRNTGDVYAGQLNDNSAVANFGTMTDTTGFFCVVRPDNANRLGYKNDALVGSVARGSIAPPAISITTSGNANFGATVFIHRMFSAGGALTAADVANYYRYLREYFATFGATP